MDLDGFIQPALDMLESCITFEPSYWETREKTLLEGNDVYILGKEITKENGKIWCSGKVMQFSSYQQSIVFFKSSEFS